MTRNEFYLACLLVFLILAGITYRDRVGGSGSVHPVLVESRQDSTVENAAPAELPPITSVININRAQVNELTSIPGIDKERAENIVSFRDRYGLFSDLRELMEVPGITRSDYERLRAFVRLAELAPLVSPDRPTGQSAQKTQVSSPLIREGGKAPVRAGPLRNVRAPVRPQGVQQNDRLPDLNRATLADLEAVDGIGEVLAQRILTARARRGGFRSWQDVEAIDGIGASRLRTIQQKFSIGRR